MHKLDHNIPIRICYVLRRHGALGNVRQGERVSLRQAVAEQLIAQGVIEALTDYVLPQDISDAGGVDNYLKKNDKARKLSHAQTRMIEKQFERTIPPKPAVPFDQQI